MDEFFVGFGIIVAILSLISFVIGIIMLFFESKRKLGLRIMVISIIAFIIGFGTCAAYFKLNLH
ncbi:hypothetical protein [Flavobacterium sp.]|jgi:hypothetical protein|uniref:hypothetical protein n=1 Tax=Flavobacterium sp. TaxID=239 RepID=UPI0037BF9926